jgi:hypothetical protein
MANIPWLRSFLKHDKEVCLDTAVSRGIAIYHKPLGYLIAVINLNSVLVIAVVYLGLQPISIQGSNHLV